MSAVGETETKPLPPPSSDEAVSRTMQEGFQRILVQGGTGLVVGGLAGLVIARVGGGSSGVKKVFAGLGAGAGAGSAWTKCSIEIEDLIKK